MILAYSGEGLGDGGEGLVGRDWREGVRGQRRGISGKRTGQINILNIILENFG